MSSLRRCAIVLAAGLLILTLAGPAAGETISGEALALRKDVAEGTVTLDGGTVLHVRESTRIYAPTGGLIALTQLPVARVVGGGYEYRTEAVLRFEAKQSSGKLIAEEIRAGVDAAR
jgi:hypothetical protein